MTRMTIPGIRSRRRGRAVSGSGDSLLVRACSRRQGHEAAAATCTVE
ncbi:MAG TPA: hypothetical protein VIL43_00060 [Burkholderiales bacterium]